MPAFCAPDRTCFKKGGTRSTRTGRDADATHELRQVLRKRSDDFVTTVTERLLTYSLGRGLDATDYPAVRKIKRDAAPDNYRFESLIQAIVTSTPFEMRTAQVSTE